MTTFLFFTKKEMMIKALEKKSEYRINLIKE